MKISSALTLALFSGLCAVGNSQVTFGFETLAATSGVGATPNFPGAYSTISETIGGVTMTVTRVGFSLVDSGTFDVHDFDGWQPTLTGPPVDWRTHALSPFNAVNQGVFIFRFSVPVSEFSFQYGDYDLDDDTIHVDAYSGFDDTTPLVLDGTLNNEDRVFGDIGQINFATFPETPFGSFYVKAGSQNMPMSMFIDNVTITPVPEPATLAVLGLGIAALGRRRRLR